MDESRSIKYIKETLANSTYDLQGALLSIVVTWRKGDRWKQPLEDVSKPRQNVSFIIRRETAGSWVQQSGLPDEETPID